MFKNAANTSKKNILNANNFEYINISKGKTPISWNQNLALKKLKFMFKLQTLCMKNAPVSSKSCMGSQNCK